jgi:hypothetical protein
MYHKTYLLNDCLLSLWCSPYWLVNKKIITRSVLKSDDWTLVCLPSTGTWGDGWIHPLISKLDQCMRCHLVSPDANPKPLPLGTNVARCGWVGCLRLLLTPTYNQFTMVSQCAPETQNELSFPGVSGARGLLVCPSPQSSLTTGPWFVFHQRTHGVMVGYIPQYLN